MKIQAYTKFQVIALLNQLMVFSSANNNQGLSAVPGRNFGEKIDNILLAFEEWAGNEPLQKDFSFPSYLGMRFK